MISELVNVCKGKENIVIWTHDYPDADAIATSYSLQFLLKQYGIDTVLTYVGSVNMLSSGKMVDAYKIEFSKPEDIPDDCNIICVDCQNLEGNVSIDKGNVFACIDHHKDTNKYEYEYKHIEAVGSCATLIADEIFNINIDMPISIATCLLWGIKMDTLNLTREVSAKDVDAFCKLYGKYDKNVMNHLENSNMELDDLKAFGQAINNIFVLADMALSYVPFDCPDGLIALLAEFILGVSDLELVVVFSLRKNGIKMSVRSIMPYLHAGDFAERVVEGIGTGGGHAMFAGAFIPLDFFKSFENEEAIGEYMKELLLKKFGEALYSGV
ncbi:MAG: DHH family phosphoesterase [Lachnospiraceae bacterium]|nr:DHH family phosphoesterase [Candidatus Colinaster equi]